MDLSGEDRLINATNSLILVTYVFMCAYPAEADFFGSGTNQFEIEFVDIGNIDNPDDTTGAPNPAGKVEYAYRMGKFEISRDMVTKANNEGGLGITMNPMRFVTGGPRDYMPASVSWLEAATFVNWLNTTNGYQPAYSFDLAGNFQVWTSAEAWQTGGENLFRHKDSFYFLPSMDEWYKAAYFDTSSNSYFDYPTGSDIAPTAVASGTAAGTAVYDQFSLQGPADVMLAGGLSPYGTMGQGGNVYEWEETDFDLMNTSSSTTRGGRGGFWGGLNGSDDLRATARFFGFSTPTGGGANVGFRVASIPEPRTVMLGAMAAVLLMGLTRSPMHQISDTFTCRRRG